VFTFNGESQAEKLDEVEYEEELNIFGCMQESIKAYWLIPFKKIHTEEKKSIKVTIKRRLLIFLVYHRHFSCREQEKMEIHG
jgi:hypothetical protein